ncbi:MAG: MinD/ParA family protein [Thermodesulfobacteriota bacterium]
MMLAGDQGATLRRMRLRRHAGEALEAPSLRSLAITSGKGGVGKTSLAANLACVLAETGSKVLLLDADMGLANVDVLLGLSPERTIKDFLAGHCPLRDVIVEGPAGIRILPAGSGQSDLTYLSRDQRLTLYAGINGFGQEYDLILIDTAAGVSPNVLHFNAMAERLLVVVTPEPTSITDAYAMIKLMFIHYKRRDFWILVNGARSVQEATETFGGLNGVVERFLRFSLTDLGWVPWDSAVARSVRSQRPFVHLYPEARATQNLRGVARRLREMAGREESLGEMTFFGPYA